MRVSRPLLCLSKSEATLLMSRFVRKQSSIIAGKNFICVSPTHDVKIYIIPATQSTSDKWNEDVCTDAVVFYAYLENKPYCRQFYNLSDGITGISLLHAITEDIIITLMDVSPALSQEYRSGHYKLSERIAS